VLWWHARLWTGKAAFDPQRRDQLPR